MKFKALNSSTRWNDEVDVSDSVISSWGMALGRCQKCYREQMGGGDNEATVCVCVCVWR